MPLCVTLDALSCGPLRLIINPRQQDPSQHSLPFGRLTIKSTDNKNTSVTADSFKTAEIMAKIIKKGVPERELGSF